MATSPPIPTPAPPRPKYCHQCGGTELEVISSREFRCPGCGFRHYINPITAVAAIIQDDRGDLLLIRRAIDPGKGQLGLPGGFVDVQETAEEAVQREVAEEVGLELDLEAYRFLVTYPNSYPHQGILWPVLDIFYTARVNDFSGASARSEVSAVTTLPPETVPLDRLAFPSLQKGVGFFLNQLAEKKLHS